ncbi:MAG: prolyl aminopeptidase [Marinobacterium sp.]|nr:prolyl aminopeptidase [Marinobacterium sp.]
MLTLFPDIHPYRERMLETGEGHTLYVEESGNPAGIPVVFVHGGPGGGTAPAHRCFFDPERYRIVLFDQRGCGRSTPHASLENNHTSALISDMEQIRQALGIEQWLLFGGSWGATLSLLYAQAHPQHVLGLILRGIFLCRDEDVHWLYQQGANHIFPDYWHDFEAVIPQDERHDMLQAYHNRLTSSNEIARMAAAKAWSVWEGRCSTLQPSADVEDHFADPHLALSMARIEAHYFINRGFLAENQILRDADKIAHLPTVIVHGRYDMVCPVKQALELHAVLPEAQLHIVRDAGHSSMEAGTIDNLVRATNDFACRLA